MSDQPDDGRPDGDRPDGVDPDGGEPAVAGEVAEPAVPPAFSWDAVAAELAATLEEHDEEAVVAGWEQVAAQLAADLGAPAAPPPGDVPGRDPDPAPLGRAPAAPPVQLEEVPERETPVEESVTAGPVTDEPMAEELEPAAVRGGLEALLFVIDSPIDEASLAAALRCPVARVRAELTALAAEYDDRRAGITLRRVGEGWRLYTREEHAPVVERHLLEGQRSRLTQAALETLAVIAYRQPVTRARVSAIRGVGVDAVVRTLVSRGLIREAGADPDTGGGLYVTTPLFLERLGLTGLDELPELAPLLPDTRSVLDEHPDS
ncbi:SMC-Scp complex subunit ScpB [Modestobacter sp. VKM Ac-2985]|uniref:SMC-Scp complex subunit ScpB n=1 Tax=Modestobacter sp. VKM Ac-2985 TaxID=3004139 RepID=UPI0022AB6441|nr:SMC-Scp complex subunit ScpB [Modestobacter sp. VKM Ac-2985]MCZ2840123.1 SMC-Scp complex subunit ScpB [Modestobacter sp. VKM Ac-2985]